MLLLGSDWKTKEQLEEALGFNKDDDILQKLKPLLFNDHTKSVKFKVANSVCPSEAFQMIAEYKSEMETAFKYQMQNLDYEKDAEESIKENKWVSDGTDGKIKNMFAQLNPKTACLLVSCIYFIGD